MINNNWKRYIKLIFSLMFSTFTTTGDMERKTHAERVVSDLDTCRTPGLRSAHM